MFIIFVWFVCVCEKGGKDSFYWNLLRCEERKGKEERERERENKSTCSRENMYSPEWKRNVLLQNIKRLLQNGKRKKQINKIHVQRENMGLKIKLKFITYVSWVKVWGFVQIVQLTNDSNQVTLHLWNLGLSCMWPTPFNPQLHICASKCC